MRSLLWLSVLLLVSCSAGVAKPPVPTPTDAIPTAEDVSVVGNRLVAGGKALTPQFQAIESFDVSAERREIVFSARRDKSFDIGLVSLDGSDVHWVPEDPADEVAVKWAPKGHKVSYVIRGAGGDIVRTVHIPTAMQQGADFGYATVKSLNWDPSGERYSVVLTSPDASEQTVSLRYDGSSRLTTKPASQKLDLNVEPFGGGVILRPSLLRYNERMPLVIWQSDHPLEWNDARSSLMREQRVALAVVRQLPAALPEDVWIDRDRVFYVCERRIDVRCRDVESIRQQLKEPHGGG